MKLIKISNVLNGMTINCNNSSYIIDVSLEKTIKIDPKDLDANLDDVIAKKLCRVTKGTWNGKNGYIIDIIEVSSIDDGIVLDTSGDVQFNVVYTDLVFKPKKGDVLDGVVTNVNQNSIVVSVGPQSVMIAHSSMPSGLEFDPYTKSYKSADMETVIQEDNEIRFRVVGVNVLANEITCTGTIDEPFLGLIK